MSTTPDLDEPDWPSGWLQSHAALRRLARALVGDEQTGEDVVQSAYLAALERPVDSSRAGWLRQKVRSCALDLLRRRRTRADHEGRLEPALPPHGPDDVAARLECHRQVAEAVAALAEPYRTTVFLRYFEDRPPSEIARLQGIPVSTVKTRLERALPQLRERLAARLGQDSDHWRGALYLTFSLPWTATVPVTPLTLAPAAPVVTPITTLGGAGALMTKKLVALGLAATLVVCVVRFVPSLSRPVAPERSLVATASVAALEPPRSVPAIESAGRPERVGVAGSSAPPAAPATTSAGCTLVVRATWADGTPAPAVAIVVMDWQRGLPARGLAVDATDASGLVRFEALPPGTTKVAALRAGWSSNYAESKLEAGMTSEVELILPAGVDVEGVVVDASGGPVARAEIWVASGRNDWLGGEIAATADASGRFRIRQVCATTSLGAIAPGYAPSPLVDLELRDTAGGAARLELVLTELGGSLSGVVRAPDGAPLAGARVSIGEVREHLSMRINGDGQEEVWTPRIVESDSDGRYVAHGLALGEQPVAVRADQHALWRGAAMITSGAGSTLDVHLSAGFSVAGIVRDARGAPLAGAVLRAFDERLPLDFVQGGQFDYYGAFEHPLARSDGEGRFELAHLPVGEADLHASPPPETERRRERGSIMRAHTRIVGVEGERLEWHPVIDEGLVLAGRVTYRDGVSMPRVFVTARNQSDGTRQVLAADSQGGFRFLNMEHAPHILGVQLWDAPAGAGPVEAHDVWPGGDEVVLSADFDGPVERERGEIVGRIDDVGQRLANDGALGVFLQVGPGSWSTCRDVEGGRFRFTDVEPGRLRVGLLSNEDPIYTGEWFELAPGERRDLGVLVTERGGIAVLELVRDDATRDVEPRFWLQRDEDLHSRKVSAGKATAVRVEGMTPGHYTVLGIGDGMTQLDGALDVRAGEETSASFTLRSAVAQAIELSWLSGADLGSLHLRVVEGDGTVHYDHETRTANIDRPYVRHAQLPLGRFRITAETGSGLAASAELELVSLDAQPPPVRLELR